MFLAFVGMLHSALRDHVIKPGDSAPDFRITTDNGQTITSRNFGGKLLLLNFWASSCEGCVEEVPSLGRLQRELGPAGLVVVGLNVDKNRSAYENFLSRFGVPYPTAFDSGKEIEHAYGTLQIPESYLIHTHGKVVEKVVGAENWSSARRVADITYGMIGAARTN